MFPALIAGRGEVPLLPILYATFKQMQAKVARFFKIVAWSLQVAIK